MAFSRLIPAVHKGLHEDRLGLRIDDPVLRNAERRIGRALAYPIHSLAGGRGNLDDDIRGTVNARVDHPIGMLLQDHNEIWLHDVVRPKDHVERSGKSLTASGALQIISKNAGQPDRHPLVLRGRGWGDDKLSSDDFVSPPIVRSFGKIFSGMWSLRLENGSHGHKPDENGTMQR